MGVAASYVPPVFSGRQIPGDRYGVGLTTLTSAGRDGDKREEGSKRARS